MSMLAMPEPDARVLARREEIVAALEAALPGAVISDPAETRAYECDALSAYRCPPMAVVLPRSTEEVARAMRICAEAGVRVVPRGAGTSLSGGSLPLADSVVIGVARMDRVLEIDTANRLVRVETGITNLAVSQAVEAAGFFYAPDPSSQLACAIAGNIAMNSGGAHCLKYGVTTNNLLGLRMVLADGRIVELGGPHPRAGGATTSSAWSAARKASSASSPRRWLRILPRPEGARPVLIGLRLAPRPPAPASPRSSARASCRWPSSSWTAPASVRSRTSPMRAIRSTSRRC
ncbi:MAG: hypothetical protein KatS3mg118_0822 [Paracoccaceae bacterium]|nr:MAG: hypothetical protein KatS3mg118_0822 [Paracoccaceae bacterium]